MDTCVDLDPLDYRVADMEQKEEEFPVGFVESLVNTNKVVVFSKSSCPHCNNTKSLLSGMGVDFKSVELDKMQEGSIVQNTLGEMTDAKTVPRIFINGQCVGGNSDLQSLDSSGELKDLLELESSEEISSSE